ncbi:aminotransferase class III-fold pyridoxal phosphate-dependent enzyme, partial [Rhizobium ruizarguesonis]
PEFVDLHFELAGNLNTEFGEENVAAFVAEPVQGAAGVIIPPETYWPEIGRICKARNILLVTDEVICGFGRLGAWFG